MKMTNVFFLCICCACISPSRADENTADTKPERIQLDNGVTLLLAPLPEARVIAVETFYPVGFCDEPAGMTQAAHLLEHIMCQGATKSYGPGESFDMLRKLGIANAETLPTFTHYTYTVPPEELKTILKIEGERLSSLKITPELISDEADKCHEEAQIVYKVPESGMVKHAFMALFQFWNHGATEVRIRSGLDQIPFDKLESFYRNQYRPDQLTVAIVGGFKKDEALALAKEYLGSIPSRKVEQKLLDWNALPVRGHITWDADVHAVCVYAPPPAEAGDRAMLSLWGTAFLQKLASKKIGGLMTFSSNTTWPVGDLPFFVYAVAKPADKLSGIEEMLKEMLRHAPDHLATDIMQMKMMVQMSGGDSIPTWKDLQDQAAAFSKTTGRTGQEAMTMILMNTAMQWGIRELNGTVKDDEITEERLKAVLEKTLDPAKLRTVTVGPPPKTEPKP